MKIDQEQQMNTRNASKPPKPEAKPIKRRCWGQFTPLSVLLLGAVIAGTELHFLAPPIPGRTESLPARVRRYFAGGQWRADSRTLAAAWDYWKQSQSEIPLAPNLTNMPVAATPTDSLPKS
jgi:hypothetical protein